MPDKKDTTRDEPVGILTGSEMSECQCYEGSVGCLGPPCVVTRPGRVTVRWATDLIRHLSTEGRVMEPGETIKVTKGLPEDARLVAVEMNQPGWPGTIAFVFEMDDEVTDDEVRVEHSVEHAQGFVPVEAIAVVAGCGYEILNDEESKAQEIVLRWLDSLRG